MARRPENELLYQTWRGFASNCLLGDKSLLWPDQVAWTAANIAAIRKRLIDNPIFDGRSFEDKLLEQMKNASPEEWMILTDAHYIYYLPSTNLLLSTRQNQIQWLIDQGHLPTPYIDWKPQQAGFTRTGQRYHQRYSQLWFIVLVAEAFKRETDGASILNKPERLQKLLDDALSSLPNRVDRAADMRHAMLYLAYPELYERCISTRDKKAMIDTFRDRVSQPLASDLDEGLRQIRAALAKDYDTNGQPFDFYSHSALRAQWKGEPASPIPAPVRVVRDKPADVASRSAEVDEVLNTLTFTRNVILYGPPGTGKTYVAQQVARALVNPQLQGEQTQALRYQRAIEGLSFHEIVALAMYTAGEQKQFTVPELQTAPLIRTRFQTSATTRPSNYLWSSLQTHTSPESKTVNVTRRMEPYLFDKDSQGRWYLTPAGREYVEASLILQRTVP